MNNWIDILENFYKEFKNYNYKTTLSIKTFEEYNKFINNNNINSFINNLKENSLFIINEIIMNFKYKFKPEYIEFHYALIYISNVIKDNFKNLDWNSGFSINNLEYYILSNFYLFIFSLLDKITTLNYMIKEKNFIESEIKKIKTEEEAIKLDNKIFRKISFDKEEYNQFLFEFKNSILWKQTLRFFRNQNEHRTIFLRVPHPSEILTTKFVYYPFIFLSLFLFLWYLYKFAYIV